MIGGEFKDPPLVLQRVRSRSQNTCGKMGYCFLIKPYMWLSSRIPNKQGRSIFLSYHSFCFHLDGSFIVGRYLEGHVVHPPLSLTHHEMESLSLFPRFPFPGMPTSSIYFHRLKISTVSSIPFSPTHHI